MNWQCGEHTIDLSGPPKIMGILNVTPDSFSDGGRFVDAPAAVHQAGRMIADGADIIDIGGESTRPGAKPVSVDEQVSRILPVVRALRELHPAIPISVDARIAAVAAAAIDAGASIINDISAMHDDPAMGRLAARTGAGMVLMHMRGRPETGYADPATDKPPTYGDVVAEIVSYLRRRLLAAGDMGIGEDQLVVDPGFGFGKDTQQNLTILHRLGELAELGRPVLVGMSRKRFVGSAMEEPVADRRLYGSLACVAAATLARASIIRVHDVAESRQVAHTCAAIRDAKRR